MRIHILGAGSIGSLVAWHLRKADNNLPISLIVKHRLLQQIRFPRCPSITMQNGPSGAKRPIGRFDLEVNRPQDGAIDIAVEGQLNRVARSTGSDREKAISKPFGPIQSLLVTTKAQDAPAGVEQLFESKRITPSTTIVLLTNGMGVYEHLTSTIFSDPKQRPNFVLATTNHGATSTGPLEFIHAGLGTLNYAVIPDPLGRPHAYNYPTPDFPPAPPPNSQFFSLHHTLKILRLLHPQLNASHESIHYLQQRMLQKLVINCCVNPLTALHDIPNGQLLDNEEAMTIIKQVCQEASLIFRQMAAVAATQGGIKTTSEDIDPATAALQFRRPFTAEDLEDAVVRTIRTTSSNISSMLQDVRRGRTTTEIEYLNGYLTRLGQLHGVPTPTNDDLADRIRMLPRERVSIEKQSLDLGQNVVQR